VLLLARDRVLTGWAVYPLSLCHWDVPWLTADASELRRITIAIARDPGPDYQAASTGYAWLPGWLAAQARQWEAVAALLLVLAVVAAAFWARRRGGVARWRRLLLLALPGIVFAAAWVLVLPPTWRHSYGAVLGTLGAVLGWLLHVGRLRPTRLLVASLGFVSIVAVASLIVRYPAKAAPLPDAPTQTVTLPSGLQILVPTSTDQCWGNALLCSSIAPADLRLLGEGIADGFTVTPPANRQNP
jgi:hypothetical protein